MESVTQAIEKTNVPALSSIRESISYCEFFASISEIQIVLDREIPEDFSIICNPLRLQQVGYFCFFIHCTFSPLSLPTLHFL
jgi:hypothetical protein